MVTPQAPATVTSTRTTPLDARRFDLFHRRVSLVSIGITLIMLIGHENLDRVARERDALDRFQSGALLVGQSGLHDLANIE
jgi:hypothetical protein